MEGAQIAVWVTNNDAGGGSIYAVNSFAKEFSDWGDGGKTDASFSMGDDGASEAEACARNG